MYRGYRTGKDVQLATLRASYKSGWSEASKTSAGQGPESVQASAYFYANPETQAQLGYSQKSLKLSAVGGAQSYVLQTTVEEQNRYFQRLNECKQSGIPFDYQAQEQFQAEVEKVSADQNAYDYGKPITADTAQMLRQNETPNEFNSPQPNVNLSHISLPPTAVYPSMQQYSSFQQRKPSVDQSRGSSSQRRSSFAPSPLDMQPQKRLSSSLLSYQQYILEQYRRQAYERRYQTANVAPQSPYQEQYYETPSVKTYPPAVQATSPLTNSPYNNYGAEQSPSNAREPAYDQLSLSPTASEKPQEGYDKTSSAQPARLPTSQLQCSTNDSENFASVAAAYKQPETAAVPEPVSSQQPSSPKKRRHHHHHHSGGEHRHHHHHRSPSPDDM